VSRRDIALGVSSALHRETRIGLKGTCPDGMDVIDTEGQDTSARDFYHGYLFDSQPVHLPKTPPEWVFWICATLRN
jgi:hypothetical protein